MKYTIHNTRLLSANELEDILHKSARMYSEYADTTLLFVFREKKADAYDYYEVQFGRNNFMHLAGIKSKNYSATDFYEACLAGVINKADCTPSRDYNTLYAKVSIMMQLLDLKKSKCYKIGEKDLITRD